MKGFVIFIGSPAPCGQRDIDHTAVGLAAHAAHQALGHQFVARDRKRCQGDANGFCNLTHARRLARADLFDDMDLSDRNRASQPLGHAALFNFIDAAEHIDQKGIELLRAGHARTAFPPVDLAY